MKRTLLIVALIAILVAVVFVLAGCEKKEEAKGIVGSWKYVSGGYVYTFNADKTGNYAYGDSKMEFTYEDDGSKVSMLYTGNTEPLELEYRIEGDKLIIKDSLGNDVEYVKQ